MSEPIKICPACNAANLPNYRFCKSCGKTLAAPSEDVPSNPTFQMPNGSSQMPPIAQQGPPNGPQTPPLNSQVPPYGSYMPSGSPQMPPAGYGIDEIDGVPLQHVHAYVGGDSKILNRFMELQVTDSKSSWCWPVFLLGFFFGFVGMSFWFFYRKIYKQAVALLVAGLLIMVLTGALGFVFMQSSMGDIAQIISQSAEQLAMGEITFAQYMSDVYGSMFSGDYMVFVMISSAIGLLQKVAAVVLALYAFSFYKRSAIDRIKAYALQQNREVYPNELQKLGGTSSAALALSIIGYIVFSTIVSFVMIIPFITEFLSTMNY